MIFLEQLALANLVEFLAALAGSYYLFRTNDTSAVRYFAWFLWLTVTVEVLGTYAGVAYYSNYEIFSFVKGTPFAGNYWIYNIYSIVAFSVYILFFALHISNLRWRKYLYIATRLFVLCSLLYLVFTDTYFKTHSVFTFFAGALIVLGSIGVYYSELLQSNEILAIRRSMPFYISIGALFYHLGFVPLVIYGRYFNMESPEFVEIYTSILHGINYFLYSLYTFGFIVCSRKRKFY